MARAVDHRGVVADAPQESLPAARRARGELGGDGVDQ